MESELVQAIQEIAQGLNQTSGFDILSLIISTISACATVAVLYYNHRTIKLAQEGMQQSLNLAFYEKMLAVANNIENGDYSNTDTEIKLLFGDTVLKNIQEIRRLKTEKAYQDRTSEKYSELLDQQPEAAEYYDLDALLMEDADAPEHLVKRYEELDKKFEILYSDDGEEYNWKNISTESKQTEEKLNDLIQKVSRDVWATMKEKLSIKSICKNCK
jgi:hypothetical protein